MDIVKVETGPTKVMFPNLAETEKFEGEDTQRYTVTMRWPKESDEAAAIEKAFKQADHTGGTGHNPIKEGKNEFTEGQIVVKAKTKKPPRVVDQDGNDIDPSRIQTGDTCRLKIGFLPYEKGPNKGVTVIFNAVQLLKKRENKDEFSEVPEQFRGASDDFPF